MTNGWTGKILRVNLSTGKISVESTGDLFKNYIGGMGFGYKILYDEVPVGTKPFDEANKVVIAVGPLTGSGAPCSSRANLTSLSTFTKDPLVVDSHMGGYFPALMKYAGYDVIIIEGKAEHPVWVNIQDDKVSIEDARFLWGKGTRATTEEICKMTSVETCVAAIGPSGENLVPMSVLVNTLNHIAGAGVGAIFGSKNLKAIGVRGTGGVQVADREKVKELNAYVETQLIGANNNHVVPSTPQAWAEFSAKGSRWTARKGLYWGAAEGGPIETGEIPPGNQNTVGFRTQKAVFDNGPAAEKYTVKMTGCHSCPIRCYGMLKVPEVKKYGVPEVGGNTCLGQMVHERVYTNRAKGFGEVYDKDELRVIINMVGLQVFDDLGVWCNYGQLQRDIIYCYQKGVFARVLPKEEYDSIDWAGYEANDPAFIKDLYERIAYKKGEISHLGDGSYALDQRWNLGQTYWDDAANAMVSPLGWPLHHANEASAQVGALINCMFNRDPMCHTHINLIGSGLPLEIKKEVAAELFGTPDAYEEGKNYSPINWGKIKYTKWSIIKMILHNSLTLCNWVWPMTVSPHKSRNYRGDLTAEAQFYSAVTGFNATEESLDLSCERIFTLHRALTVKQMGTQDMRGEHDLICNWVFDKDPDIAVFTPGTDKMDRADMRKALTMFYMEMGWDPVTGAPTRKTLERLDLGDVANDLAKLGLLPPDNRSQAEVARTMGDAAALAADTQPVIS